MRSVSVVDFLVGSFAAERWDGFVSWVYLSCRVEDERLRERRGYAEAEQEEVGFAEEEEEEEYKMAG